jgi:hypothetical protein
MISRRSIRFNQVTRVVTRGNLHPLTASSLRPFAQPVDSRILVKLYESVEPVSLLCENRFHYGASHKATTNSLVIASVIGFFVLVLVTTSLLLAASVDQIAVPSGEFASPAQLRSLTQPGYPNIVVPNLAITTFFAIS